MKDMKDILDGHFVGPLTPQEVVDQFLYRILIHETWAGLVVEDPVKYSPEVYGDYDYHLWAINGYNEAIRHIKAKYVIVDKAEEDEAVVDELDKNKGCLMRLFGR